MLMSYIPGINSLIYPKRDYVNIFSEKWSMNYMDGYKKPSCNIITKCIRLIIHQNKWYYYKETEATASNIGMRSLQ